MHFLTIAHCNEGKVDYKKVVRTQSNKFIDWDVPFCLLKPKISERVVGLNQAPTNDNEVPGNEKSSRLNEIGSLTIGDQKYSNVTQERANSNEQHVASTTTNPMSNILQTMKHKSIQINELIRKKFDLTMEKLTNGKWIEYSGKNKNIHFQQHGSTSSVGEYSKLDGSTPQQSPAAVSPLHTALTQEINNLICFKMARRKRYAKRKISFFMPYTFVGGLFECLIPLDQKHQILESFLKNNQNDQHYHLSLRSLSGDQFFMVLQNFQIKCDPHLSRPISPLIAEDSTKQWFENKFHHLLNPKFTQTIPYLTTTTTTTSTSPFSPFSPLQLLTTPLKLIGFPLWNSQSNNLVYSSSVDATWDSKIDVNEDYDYNDIDLHVISKMVAYLANLLNQLIAPLDFNSLVKGYNRANKKERNPSLVDSGSGHDSDDQEIQLLSTDEKPHPNYIFDVLSWDQKVSYWLASSNDSYINRILLRIESGWDKLNLD